MIAPKMAPANPLRFLMFELLSFVNSIYLTNQSFDIGPDILTYREMLLVMPKQKT
jgi:hypothetical protein